MACHYCLFNFFLEAVQKLGVKVGLRHLCQLVDWHVVYVCIRIAHHVVAQSEVVWLWSGKCIVDDWQKLFQRLGKLLDTSRVALSKLDCLENLLDFFVHHQDVRVQTALDALCKKL